ncbi:MAG: amidase family protein [Actinomycetota bacterium]|nr:amidase family protein [Actinomycetota bacterium]
MTPLSSRPRRWRLLSPLLAFAIATAAAIQPAHAVTDVEVGATDTWSVQDDVNHQLDTGSVHRTTDDALIGYGGLRVEVDGGTSPLNGILLRGFGITWDEAQAFESTVGVEIDGLVVRRTLTVDDESSYGRFFDTFDNTTDAPLTVEVAFGGQLGYGTGTNQSAIAATSDGDTVITGDDGWVSWYTPSQGPGSASANGPSATTVGTPGFDGALDRMGNFLRDPFDNPLPEAGHEANHPAFVNSLVVPPGEAVSLAHFVVTGLSGTDAEEGEEPPAPGSQVDAVEALAAELTASPDLSGLSDAEICALANYDVTTISTFDAGLCALAENVLASEGLDDAVGVVGGSTSVDYDVVGRTITDLIADMESGETTAEEITRAYLDRIEVYDQGPFGLHSVLAVAPDALEQARAADAARAEGDDRPLLGVPILVKDIIDTADMPTTGGSELFEGYVPSEDAWQVARLREAGAIILGKTNLSTFAFSGHYSESDFGQVWNAFDPSRSSIGSSGGSSVAVASSFGAAAFGTQTGDSLWGPSGAASLFSLRGTDGMQSSAGTMPLTIIQDYVGFIAQSPEDLALLLEVAAVDNPDDVLDDVANGNRPEDWSAYLSEDALVGKVIGIPEEAFDDPFGTSVVSDELRARFAEFGAAGATLVPMPAAPDPAERTFEGSTFYEGWSQWLEAHPDSPVSTVEDISEWGGERMTDEDLRAFEAWRAEYRAMLAEWMDESGVDAVLYPTELSDISLNDSVNPSFGRRDPESSASGVPTVVFPAGVNAHGNPVGFQLQGKAFQDAELLGFAYAFDAVADGRVLPDITPPLPVIDAE